MKLSDKMIPLRWRSVALGVLLVWVVCRGACIAGPLWLNGCCVDEESQASNAELTHAAHHHHGDHGHDDGDGGTAVPPTSHDPAQPQDSNHPTGATECCDSDAVLAKASVTVGDHDTRAAWTTAWILTRILSDTSIETTFVVVSESPPMDLQSLSLLLLGPGHQPHGPPLL